MYRKGQAMLQRKKKLYAGLKALTLACCVAKMLRALFP